MSAAATVDTRAVMRGALAGTALVLVISVAGALIDRAMDDFDDSAWPVTLFLCVLVAFALAGGVAARAARFQSPLTTGALAGLGAFVAWVPIRVLIWTARDDSKGLLTGDDPVFTLGGLFANVVFATALGMLGALIATRRATRSSSGGRNA
jgi:hypothetical protein